MLPVKWKAAPGWVIGSALLVGLALFLAGRPRGPDRGVAVTEPDGIVAFYFHGPVRCPTCERLEAAWREAIGDGFADELRAGRLRMASVDYLAPESETYRRDFGTVGLGIVLAEVREGRPARLRRLGGVWDHIGAREALVGHIRDEVRRFLEEGE